jgi:ParB-like chromosome segregation protein Spo0J
MKLSELRVNPANPRIIRDDRFKKLVNSIREFPKMMELRPIIFDDSNGNMILGGNMRYRALQELKFREIPDNWTMAASQLTEQEKRRFVIVDNVGFGEHNWEQLANEEDEAELAAWGLDIPHFQQTEQEEEGGRLGIFPLSIVLNAFEYKQFQQYKKENSLKTDTEAFKVLFEAKHATD